MFTLSPRRADKPPDYSIILRPTGIGGRGACRVGSAGRKGILIDDASLGRLARKIRIFEYPHYLGHRDRLRERFAGAGGDALPDYELFELILFPSVPRRDVKALAKALFGAFRLVCGNIGAGPAARDRGLGDSVSPT